MRGIVERVDIERQVLRRPGKRGDELVEQDVAQAKERACADGVLEAGKCRLAGEIGALDRAIADQFEDRIASQHVVIVLVGVVGENAVDPHACHFQKAMIEVTDVPPISQGFDELPC